MRHRSSGFSLIEVVLAAAILATVVGSTFQLFSLQRHQVASAQREIFLHAYGLQRLAEEESRLNVTDFIPGKAAIAKVPSEGGSLAVQETLSVAPVAACTGLWRLTIDLTYADESTRGASRSLSLCKLVVDRNVATRLPAAMR